MVSSNHIIDIEKIVHGGSGLARLPSGIVALTPFVLPGEKVKIKEVTRRNDLVKADLLEIIEPSPHRIDPPCKYFQNCGGCHLQHADYSYQIEIKKNILAEFLHRNLNELKNEFKQFDFLKCKRPFNYRQRIRLQVGTGGRLGFFSPQSHCLEEIDNCPLAERPINDVFEYLRKSEILFTISRQLQAIELLLSPDAQQVVIILHLTRKPRAADQNTAMGLAEHPLIKSVWLAGDGFAMTGPFCTGESQNHSPGLIGFSIKDLPMGRTLQFSFEPGGFCQVNLYQNAELLRLLLEWISPNPSNKILDLFCGMGNFSLPLALSGCRIIGTDVQNSAIRSAKKNAENNKLINCHFFKSDAARAVNKLIMDNEKFDTIILDPPRQGCRHILSDLPKLEAKRIMYISCDPSTLARDLKELNTSGYRLVKIAGLDMFPQTFHFETAALLERES